MLVKISELLKDARQKGYAVAAVGAVDELTCRASISAAEEMNSPLIFLCLDQGNPDMDYFGRLMNDLILRSRVPITTVLDHSGTFDSAIRGIKAGFQTIMVDRSQLPFEENARQVKELTKIAHGVSVEVEAELGHVGSGANYETDGVSALTVPEEAVRFVEETGVDCLAVAIGTAHGVYKGTPSLRFDLLGELAQSVPVPLVLHGGSGTGDANLSEACKKGICKVNIVNDLYRAAYNAVLRDGMEGNRIYDLLPVLSMGYKEAIKHFIRVLGSENKA